MPAAVSGTMYLVRGLCRCSQLGKIRQDFSYVGRSYSDDVQSSCRQAPLAQLVEQLTLNQWVPGSNP